jgi:hypothetical protein
MPLAGDDQLLEGLGGFIVKKTGLTYCLRDNLFDPCFAFFGFVGNVGNLIPGLMEFKDFPLVIRSTATI